jgi:hypothetical protein
MSVDTTAPGPHVTAVYCLAAPGGTWGPEDDGQYTVSLRPGAVRDTSGNVTPGGPIGTFDVSLGSVPFDARNPLTYTDASGDAVTVSLKGPGSGVVRFTGSRPADASAIELHGTTGATTLLVRTGPAGTSVGRITTDGGLKSITGKTTDLVGDGDDLTSDVGVPGGVGRITLRSAAGRSAMSLGGFATGPGVSLVLGSASEVSVTSFAPFKLIRAAEWLAPTGFGRIQGPGIRSIVVPGTFQADVLCQAALGSAKLGAVEGSEFVVDAGIGSFVARSMRQSKVLVGLTPPIEQYQFPAAVMRSLNVREAFVDSAVDCPNILRASVTAPSGSTIRADRIQRLQVRGTSAPVLRVGLDDPADSFVEGGLTVTLI